MKRNRQVRALLDAEDLGDVPQKRRRPFVPPQKRMVPRPTQGPDASLLLSMVLQCQALLHALGRPQAAAYFQGQFSGLVSGEISICLLFDGTV